MNPPNFLSGVVKKEKYQKLSNAPQTPPIFFIFVYLLLFLGT